MRPQILVPIHIYPDQNTEELAPHAAAIARHLGGEVHALVLLPAFPDLDNPFGNTLIDLPAVMKDRKAKCRAEGSRILAALKSALQPAGVPLRSAEVECLVPAVGDLVASRARYYDLTLVGLVPEAGALRVLAEAALFGSGRPTLLVPENVAPTAPDHILIAWDGSRAAARAVADARDLLERAASITVATVTGEKQIQDGEMGARLAEHLAAHGWKAESVRVPAEGRPVGEALQAQALAAGAGLMVMGGYGHSRLREFILGGATKGVLNNLKLPVMLAH